MKNKKSAVIAAAVVCLVAVVLVLIIPAITKSQQNKLIEQYTESNLELYAELNVITDSVSVDGNAHSLAGIKEAVRLGADTVTVDLCFTPDGTPVIDDDYTDITDSTLKAEEIFKLMSEENYKDININFRLRQLTSLSEFNRLVAEYDVSKRVIITGIDSNRYSLISGTDTPVKVYFDFEPADTAESSVESVLRLMTDYSLGGIVIEAKDASKELIDALSQKGVPYIISNVDKEVEMYCVMSYGAYAIDTDSPQFLKEAHNSWKNITLQRLDASILDELNK
ncbi:MAG: hypothetical protein IJZ57_05530 [Clostridia bacterium]|nr:hypothetical protein [Clostridia bacterium]